MTSTYSAAQLFKVGSPLRDVKFSASPSVPSTKIRIAVSYVALSPLDIWRSKFGLLVKAENLPMTLGGTFAGKVLQIGDEVPKNLEFGVQVGELVSGWAGGLSGSMQEILDVEWWCVSKISGKVEQASAATFGDSLTTAIWSLSQGGIRLSLPILESNPSTEEKDQNILVWGGASSVGQFSIQILKYSGYKNVYVTASSKHHESLKKLGAKAVFDYNDKDFSSKLLEELKAKGLDGFQKVLDCIGDIDGSLSKIKEVVSKGKPSIIAAMLPYVNKKGSEVFMSIEETGLTFPSNVEVVGVRTHFYHHSEFNKNNIQPKIIPSLISEGVVQPNKVRLVGLGKETLAERFQEGLRILEQGVSGERVVVQVQ